MSYSFDNSFIKFDSKGRAFAVVDDDDSDDEFEYDYDFRPPPPSVKRDLIKQGKDLLNLDSFMFQDVNSLEYYDELWDEEASSSSVSNIKFKNSGLSNIHESFKPKNFGDVPNMVKRLQSLNTTANAPSTPAQVTNQGTTIKRAKQVDQGDSFPDPFVVNPTFTQPIQQPTVVNQPPVPPPQLTQTATPLQPPGATNLQQPTSQQQPLTVDSSGNIISYSLNNDYVGEYNKFLKQYETQANKFGNIRFDKTKSDRLNSLLTTKAIVKYIGINDSYYVDIIKRYQESGFFEAIFHPFSIDRLKNLVLKLQNVHRTFKFHEISNMKFIYVGHDGNEILRGKVKSDTFITFRWLKSAYSEEYNALKEVLIYCNNPLWLNSIDPIFSSIIINKYFLNDKRFFILPTPNYVHSNVRFKFNELCLLSFMLPSHRDDFYITEYSSLLAVEDFPRFIINYTSFEFIAYKHFKTHKFPMPKDKPNNLLDYRQDIFTFFNI